MKLAHELRTRVAAGEALFGTFVVELTAPAVVPILKHCGFGFYVIDLEHGCFDDSELRALISAGKQYGLCPMVRVADAGGATITRALDAGAEGVIVAMIQSMDEVRLCVGARPRDRARPDGRRHPFRRHPGTLHAGLRHPFGHTAGKLCGNGLLPCSRPGRFSRRPRIACWILASISE